MEEYKLSKKALRKLRELTNREEQLHKDCDAWFNKYMLEACKNANSIEELKRFLAQASLGNCDPDGKFRDLPGLMEIHIAFAVTELKKRLGEYE